MITKFDLLGSGVGSPLQEAVCGAPGCDPCTSEGWFGDLECDQTLIDAGFCAGTDPDCEVGRAQYYVAPDGSPGAAGTESQPFGSIQQAIDAALPGDIVYLRGGTYRPTEATRFRSSGAAGAPIVLRAYPGEVPIIDASDVDPGDEDVASTPTWHFDDAQHWRIVGPLVLTEGRGAAVVVEGATTDVEFRFVEASYNGRTASRGGHGFHIVEAQWASVSDVRFINCDAHHNANHRTRPGEDVAENLYQHGDGFRIKSGRGVALIGCRAWHNLDDGYDLTQAPDPVLLYDSWAAYSGRDDAAGSMTGTPGYTAEWGEGIKLTYDDDVGQHRCIRCLSWSNVHLGYRLDGGPVSLVNCTAVDNGRRAIGWNLLELPFVFTNNLDVASYRASTLPLAAVSAANSWDESTGVVVGDDDFVTLDDTGMLGARGSDGSLPVADFARLAPRSDLIDAGVDPAAGWFLGAAPDLGCFERE